MFIRLRSGTRWFALGLFPWLFLSLTGGGSHRDHAPDFGPAGVCSVEDHLLSTHELESRGSASTESHSPDLCLACLWQLTAHSLTPTPLLVADTSTSTRLASTSPVDPRLVAVATYEPRGPPLL